jgi:putative oxidoreductase
VALTSTALMTEIAKSKKVPAARPVVVASGVLLAVSVIMVPIGVRVDLAALLLVFSLVPTALVMQNFWAQRDPQIKVLI